MAKSFEKLPGLSGQLWPIHLKPLEDELLSSWIIRLAHAHRYKAEEFCTVLFGRGSSIFNRDIDLLAPEYLRNTLTSLTGASAFQIDQTTLKAFNGYLCEKLNDHGRNKWIVPLGVHSRKRTRHGLSFCPLCLKNDDLPYYRRRWRLAFSTVCTEHQIRLLDACPVCHAPITPHRADMTGKGVLPTKDMIVHCCNCEFDLRKSKVKPASDPLVSFQKRIEDILDKGWGNWADSTSMYSNLYFDGLHSLITGLTSRETNNRLFKSKQHVASFAAGWKSRMLEEAPIDSRHKLFLFLSALLSNWPNNFVDFVQQFKISYSDLRTDSKHLVYWYENIIKKECWKGNPIFTDDEKNKLIEFVEYKTGYYSNVAAQMISGRDISGYARDIFKSTITDDIYDDLLVSLDHEIAGTRNQETKSLLLRDKIMFSLAYIFKLGQSELANLTIKSSILNLNDSEYKPDFYYNAESTQDAQNWIKWYLINLRSKLRPKDHCDKLFISSKTGFGIKESAIGSRFKRAVDSARLHRQIKSYSIWLQNSISTSLTDRRKNKFS